MAKQTINGKAFEYAILLEFYERLKLITTVSISENEFYHNAEKCFDPLHSKEKDTFSITASAAINFLIDI